MAKGIERSELEIRRLARERNALIERAKSQGVFASSMGGWGNTGKVVLLLEDFKRLLDRLSHADEPVAQ